MTGQAERAEVVEVALPSSFSDRPDMVRIPQGPPGLNGLEAPDGKRLHSGLAAAAFERSIGGDGIGAAVRADTAIASKDLIAQIAGVRTQPPLMHAVLRTEGAATARENLHLTPAAEWQTVRPQRQRSALRAAGFGEDSRGQRGHR